MVLLRFIPISTGLRPNCKVRADQSPLTGLAVLCDLIAVMHGRTFLALLIAALTLFLARLDVPLLEPQEARYAEIPRQMLTAGDWLTPTLHGHPYLDKPPLLYWLVIVSYKIFGVHDWAARLIPAAAGVLTVLLTYLWGRRVAGPRAGLLGAMVLCLSARYIYLARMLAFDTLLCLWVTASLAAAHIALREGQRRWWVLCGAACGLGILTKGPVALVLLVVPVLVLMFLDRRRLASDSTPSGTVVPGLPSVLCCLGMMLLVAGPWFVFMALRHADFLRYFFWEHHVVRFMAPFDHEEPFWFHIPGVLLGMLPWALLLPGARRKMCSFPLLCACWGLLFFSLSGCKRTVYILPVMPPLALGLGCHLDAARPWSHRLTLRFAAGTFALLLLAVLFVLPWYNERFGLRSAVEACADADTPIACYPRSWDSVSFYLQRDVRIYSHDQRAEFLEMLSRQTETLVFLRAGRDGNAILDALPPTRVFTLERRVGSVLIGRVRPASRDQSSRSAAADPVK